MKSCERLETAEYREERLGIEDTLNSGKLICTSGCHFSLFHTPLASEKLLCQALSKMWAYFGVIAGLVTDHNEASMDGTKVSCIFASKGSCLQFVCSATSVKLNK